MRFILVMILALALFEAIPSVEAYTTTFSPPYCGGNCSQGGYLFYSFASDNGFTAEGHFGDDGGHDCQFTASDGKGCTASVTITSGVMTQKIYDSVGVLTGVVDNYQRTNMGVGFKAAGGGTATFLASVHLKGSVSTTHYADGSASWIARIMLRVMDASTNTWVTQTVLFEWSGSNGFSWDADYTPSQPVSVSLVYGHTYWVMSNLYLWMELNPGTSGNAGSTMDFQNNGGYAGLNSLAVSLPDPQTPICTAGASPTVGTHGYVTPNFTASCSGGAPPYIYYWQFHDTFIPSNDPSQTSSLQNPTHAYTCGGGVCSATFYPTLAVQDSVGFQTNPAVPSITAYCRTNCPTRPSP